MLAKHIISFVKKKGPKKAEYFLDTILAGLPIATVPNNFKQVRDAARIITLTQIIWIALIVTSQ